MLQLRWFLSTIALVALLAMPGFTNAEVTTERDDKGVWFIEAEDSDSLHEVFKAMGYAAARDRLWQMETFRRTANGTLAAIFGEDYLEQDMWVRITGYSDTQLTEGYKALDAETKDIIDGYVAGINERIGEVTADPSKLPFEFRAMGQKLELGEPLPVEKWTPEDVLAWETMLLRRFDPGASTMGQITNMQLMGYLQQVFGESEGESRFSDLRWENDTDAQTYIPDDGSSQTVAADKEQAAPERSLLTADASDAEKQSDNKTAEKSFDPADWQKTAETIQSRARTRQEKLKAINAYVKMGSYAWVVDGDKTESGNPILYSGPQMGFSVPAICQEGSIEAGDLKVSGMSIPGLPGIVIGRTPHHAWSMQVGHAHTTDYYIESPNDVQAARTETIEVAGGGDVEVPVYTSDHGPVINPMPYNPDTYTQAEDGPIITWRYSHRGHEFETVSAFLDLARAESMDEFGSALEDVAVSQHFCYADKDGNIAYWMSGMDPVRPEGEYRLPQGFQEEPAEWGADTELKPLSTDRNPDQGFYGGWNNKTSDEYNNSYNNFSYSFGPFHRAHVIEDYLSSNDNLSFEDVRDLALNIATTDSIRKGGNPWEFVKEDFRDAVENHSTEQRQDALQIMEGFDGHFVAGGQENWVDGTDRSDAWILADAWIRKVIDLTFTDELGTGQSGIYTSGTEEETGEWKNPTILFNVILHALDEESDIENNHNWFDDVVNTPDTEETADQIIVAALDNVLADLGERPWGEDKRDTIEFNHDLFNEEPLDENPLHEIPFASRSTYAHCVELGSDGPMRIESMFALGQSGNILANANREPVFDDNFFSMTAVYDSFAHRDFPTFAAQTDDGDGDENGDTGDTGGDDDDDTCFIRAIRPN
ncbi:MAG: penicillin acylase family protein [Thermodesulfobacteriota bacterium]